MASEEELEGLERAVGMAMLWPLARQVGGVLLAVASLVGIEAGVVGVALWGALSLPAPIIYVALAVYAIVLTSRAWWRVFNFKRRPTKPGGRASALLKVGSLPLNALMVPAFADTMPLWVAVGVASLVTVVEFTLWRLVRGRFSRQLDNVRDLLDGGTPRTWEV